MKRSCFKHIAAGMLLLCMLFLFLSAPLAHCHDCSGADCPVCRALQAVAQLFFIVSAASLRFISDASAVRLFSRDRRAFLQTPVLLCVRLNN